MHFIASLLSFREGYYNTSINDNLYFTVMVEAYNTIKSK